MKLVINENQKEKVNNLIYQTIDSMFDIDEMIPYDREDYEKAPLQVIDPIYVIPDIWLCHIVDILL
jgi:hypothetical protein